MSRPNSGREMVHVLQLLLLDLIISTGRHGHHCESIIDPHEIFSTSCLGHIIGHLREQRTHINLLLLSLFCVIRNISVVVFVTWMWFRPSEGLEFCKLVFMFL